MHARIISCHSRWCIYNVVLSTEASGGMATAEGKVRENLPHDYSGSAGLHTREEVEASREAFSWKVVDPFPGEAHMIQTDLCHIMPLMQAPAAPAG